MTEYNLNLMESSKTNLQQFPLKTIKSCDNPLRK